MLPVSNGPAKTAQDQFHAFFDENLAFLATKQGLTAVLPDPD
jgi:hypothetical protein